MDRIGLALTGTFAALLLAACGQAGAQPIESQPPTTPDANGEVRIVSKDLKFLQTNVSVAANKPFRIVLDNQEAAPHNVTVYRDDPGKPLSRGEIFSGPGQRTQDVPALQPGNYSFLCDVHPDMKGAIAAR